MNSDSGCESDDLIWYWLRYVMASIKVPNKHICGSIAQKTLAEKSSPRRQDLHQSLCCDENHSKSNPFFSNIGPTEDQK